MYEYIYILILLLVVQTYLANQQSDAAKLKMLYYGFCCAVIPIGVQKGGPSYSAAIYTMDIAHNIDIPL